MGVSWDVSAEMVDLLVADESVCVNSKLQAVAVLQHCSLKDLSLFEFFQTYTLDGLRLVPVGEVSLPAGVSDCAAAWEFSDWRDDPTKPIAWRLERLRKHVAEVRMAGDMRLLESLLNYERQLAKQCEPVRTLGLVADDPEDAALPADDSGESVAGDLESDEPLAAEAADIAAVLENPKSVVVTPEPERVNSKGQKLVSDATLKEMYAAAKLIGFQNDIAAQEMLCAKLGVGSVGEVTEAAAVKIIDAMKKRLAAV